MQYPEIFLLPVLMLADYFMTLYSSVLLDVRYKDHFKSEHLELNPTWQKEVAAKKWFNPRHLLLTFLYSAFFVLLSEIKVMPPSFIQGMMGCVFIIYTIVIGRHIGNILLALRLNHNPQDLSGEITLSHLYLLHISAYQSIGILVVMILLAVFSPTPFVTGALIGSGVLVLYHYRWIARHKRDLSKQKQAEKAQPEE